MAIKLIRQNKFVPQWKDNKELPAGEQIQLFYSTLTIEDMFEVQKQTGVNLFAGIPVDANDVESFQKFWRLCQYLIGKYTSGWVNVDIDGIALTTGETVSAGLGPGHLELLMEVAGEIVSRSMGTAEQIKNSASQSEPKSEDSALIAPPALSPVSSKNETVEIGL